jgi:hypothetical protein
MTTPERIVGIRANPQAGYRRVLEPLMLLLLCFAAAETFRRRRDGLE